MQTAPRPVVVIGTDGTDWCSSSEFTELHKHLAPTHTLCEVGVNEIPPKLHHVDILHALWWPGLTRLCALLRPRHAILHICDHASWAPPNKRFQPALARADAITVTSTKLAAAVRSRVGPRMPIFLLPDGIDLELFSPQPRSPDGKFTIGWLGTTRRTTNAADGYDHKGVRVLNDAVRSLRQAGHTDIHGRILDAATGQKWPHHKIPEFLHTLDAYACLSDPIQGEGTPRPPIEALSCGIPVISTDVGVMDTLITPANQCGMLLPNRQVATVKAAILQAKQRHWDPQACRRAVTHLSWAGICKSLAAHYSQVTQGAIPHNTVGRPQQRKATAVPAAATAQPAPQGTQEFKALQRHTKLHLGSGSRILPGWCNVDIKSPKAQVQADALDLQLPADHYDVIYACHMLEHVFLEDTVPLLKKWWQALRPGGIVRLAVPDLRLIVANTVECHKFGKDPNPPLFGDCSKDAAGPDRHRQTFVTETLTRVLHTAGFEQVRPWKSRDIPEIHKIKDWSSHDTITLNLEAIKPLGDPVKQAVPSSNAGMHLSVIAGTYNRLQSLQRLIHGIRQDIDNCDMQGQHEFVLVDGGSTDGTPEWVKSQADCKLVHGDLSGAINAFNAAYQESSGELVFQVNDDVELVPGGLQRAINELHSRPELDVVAFAFSQDQGKTWRRLQLAAVPHVNIGLFRRLAVDDCICAGLGAFWGDEHARTSDTYGGDSLLSLMLQKRGWHVAFVDGAGVLDHLTQDALREKNAAGVKAQGHHVKFRRMAQEITGGVAPWGDGQCLLPASNQLPPRSKLAAGPPERVFMLPLAGPREPQIGHRRAFQAGFSAYGEHLRNSTPRSMQDVLEQIRGFAPSVIFLQVQREKLQNGGDCWGLEAIRALKAAAPVHCIVTTWNGDVSTSSEIKAWPWEVTLGSQIDLQLFSDTTRPTLYRQAGVHRTGYLQIGYERGVDDVPRDLPQVYEPLRDSAVFLGNNYIRERVDIITRAQARLGSNAACLCPIGGGWTNHQVHANYPGVTRALNSALYHHAKMSVGFSLQRGYRAYQSGRIKRIGPAGGFLLQNRFPEMGTWGLVDGEHCVCWDTPEDLADLITTWSNKPRADTEPYRQALKSLAEREWSWDAEAERLLHMLRLIRKIDKSKALQ